MRPRPSALFLSRSVTGSSLGWLPPRWVRLSLGGPAGAGSCRRSGDTWPPWRLLRPATGWPSRSVGVVSLPPSRAGWCSAGSTTRRCPP